MPTRRQFLVNTATGLFATAGVSAIARAAANPAAKPLQLGVLPYRNTRALFELMQPVADYLTERLQRRTLLVTAPSLREFDLRFLSGAYELAYVSPHTARIAQVDQGMWPILQLNDPLYVVVLVRADSSYTTLRDLAGKRVLSPDRFRASYYLGRELFANANVPDSIQAQSPMYQESMIFELVRSKCDAVVMNQSILVQLPPDQRSKLRVVAESRKIPNAMFVAARDSTAEQRREYSSVLMEFFSRSPAGKRYVEEGLASGVRPVTQRDLESLDALAAAHRKVIEEARGSAFQP